MLTDRFDYQLPPELIASAPSAARDGARMMVLGPTAIEHRNVREFAELVPEGALLVLNDTRVRRARIFGRRASSGGRVELLFLHPAPRADPERRPELWVVLVRANKRLHPGDRVRAGSLEIELIEVRGAECLVAAYAADSVEQVLEREGSMPLPPYMHRAAELLDNSRYQTVYAERVGSAAAPTAGLHLTHEMLTRLAARGVQVGRLELQIGTATFMPVKVADLDQHPMHEERFALGAELACAVAQARELGRPVVAVGTTVVRALESAADPERPGLVSARAGSTRLLIQPGYPFRVVDALLTNFHMPRSTLLALVSAFAGHERVLAAYGAAVRERYRFLSYGDAMWIPRRAP